jgi:NAD(P)-dependent dehydrogenase (short-subunit alcohol dehydrogenase family)
VTEHGAPTAIVTGAGSSGPGVGIGKAIAVVLARRGFRLVLADRSDAALTETVALVAAEVSSEGAAGAEGAKGAESKARATCEAIVADVSLEADCARIVAAARGRVDVLVNNVGVFGPLGGVAGVEPSSWADAMGVNVTSMAMMAKHVSPVMTAGGGGSIVNMASIAALAGTGSDALFYATSKGAVVALTRHLASCLGPAGIRVNAVAPGMVDTPMVADRTTDAWREKRRLACPLRRDGTAWDVAEAVAFLCSDAAAWISGVLLPVDGGLMAIVPATEGPWPGEERTAPPAPPAPPASPVRPRI